MKYISIIIAICIFFLSAPQIQAESISVNISPSVINVIAKPGSVATFSYNLENQGDPVLIILKVVSFTTADDQGHPRLDTELKTPSTFSISNKNLKLNEPFLLRTNQKQRLDLKIETPENTPDNDYYYTLLATTSPFPTKEGETTLDFSTTIGGNILVSITQDGTLDTKAAITLFTVPVKHKIPFLSDIPIYDSFDSVPLILMLKNTGRNYISPQGTVAINGIGTKKQYPVTVSNIIHDSQRLITVDDSCQEDCFKNVSITLKGFFIGKYNVSTALHFYPGSPYIYGTTSFIAFPFKLGTAIVVGLIVIYALKRRLKK